MSVAEQIAGIEARLEAELGKLPANGPLISIVMPTRDRACCIGRAVASLQRQGYQDWELIIVDDGSTDGTEAVVAGYRADARIRYLPAAPCGAAAARNLGLAEARGELVGYLDSDNEFGPRYLAAMAAFFGRAAAGTAYAALLRDVETGGQHILFEPFDRAALVEANFIDLNVFMHRRCLFRRHGGFDTQLRRMIDWDLILRYTAEAPAYPVPVLGAHYHVDATGRISAAESFPEAFRRIRAKGRKPTRPARPMRVLAIVQDEERARLGAATEIPALRRLGVEMQGCGSAGIAERIAAFRPDILHAHGLASALALAERGLPVTARAYGGAAEAAALAGLFGHPNIRQVYADAAACARFPAEARLRPFGPVFDAADFGAAPSAGKSPFLVFAAAIAEPRRDFSRFLEIAALLPDHVCVLALRQADDGACLRQVLAARARLGSPAYVLADLPRAEVAHWLARAGLYLHAEAPDGGMPLGIAEALASGCQILVPADPALFDYVREAGTLFTTAAEAAERIAATSGWDAATWARVATRAQDRGWSRFSGDAEFFTLHEDWAQILGAAAG